MNKLFYNQPASAWGEALPIGNGRLGAMVFGRPWEERLQCNEDSLWYGGSHQLENPLGSQYLDEVRSLLFEGKPKSAFRLAKTTMLSNPAYHNPYQPLCDLNISIEESGGELEDYRRELDMSTGIVSVEFRCGGIDYKRHVYSSFPQGIMVVQLQASQAGALSFQVSLERRPFDPGTQHIESNGLAMVGQCGSGGVKYAAAVKAHVNRGQVCNRGSFLCVEGADHVTLIFAASTTFREEDPLASVLGRIDKSMQMDESELRSSHISDHRGIFERMSFELGNDEQCKRPIDERVLNVQKGNQDWGLAVLLFKYGRYLLMASSRPGSLPANLQGIWNEQFRPPWESSYTLNINCQMNYWPAEVANLSECHEPLFDFIQRLAEKGAQTAKVSYNADGWVAHHKSDLWAHSDAECKLPCAIWPMGGAWLVMHLWEHYRFSGDTGFLEKVWPVIKGAAQFFVDYLVEAPDGSLVSGPSGSPENHYISESGEVGSLCMGPTMDIQIIKNLFSICYEVHKVFDLDESFVGLLKTIESRLPPLIIGSRGQLLEWQQEYVEVEPGHRHVSHLWDVFPGQGITFESSPELYEAARKSLELRVGYGGAWTGWSRAWAINLHARFCEGRLAGESIQDLMEQSLMPNLFDNHPPFQIDGNFGYVSGVCEMLLQSHLGTTCPELDLLPALPEVWPQGSINGLKARGDLEIDLSWKSGLLQKVSVKAKKDQTYIMRYGKRKTTVKAHTGILMKFDGELNFLS